MSRIISLHYADVPSCSHSKKERVVSLDLAKGFTVLFIPAIHTVMLYSSMHVHASWLGTVLALIAEWPGAQVFMFVMGMSFSFSRKTTKQQLIRAAIIFASGYALNFFKFIIPYWCGWLPSSFINDLHFSHAGSVAVHLFLVGDILQFAGIALAMMAIIKRIRWYAVVAIVVCYMIVLCSNIFWDVHHDHLVIDHFLHLMGGDIDDVFFPVFPWLIYPLAGLAVGRYFQGPSSLLPLFICGVFLFAGGYAMQFVPFHFPDSLFWRTYPDKTIMHLGFVMVWVSGWFTPKPPKGGLRKFAIINKWLNILKDVLVFCGRNISLIYLVQWVLIFWMLPLFGYQQLDMGESLVAMGFVYVGVFGIVFLFGKKRKPG